VSSADRHPVVLVHGIWKSGAAFARMSRYLRERGFEVHPIDLVPNDGSAALEDLAAQIAAFVAAKLPAGPLDLVGFSMGGVAGRYYVQRLGGHERVRRLVTVSSPHHGTATAYLAGKPGALQMRPGSSFLADLNGDLSALARLDVTTLWTPLDLMIVPADSSRLPVGTEVLVAAPLHGLMLHDPRSLRAIAAALSAPLSTRVTGEPQPGGLGAEPPSGEPL
jgi:triacylglycerol lipase